MRPDLTSRADIKARQRGGAGILAALFLLALMATLATGAARNTLRELAMAGPDLHGTRAFFAADSGLAWVLAGGEATEAEVALDPQDGTSFRVEARFLGGLPRPGDPRVLDPLWEVTSHGYCRPGGEVYHQICRALVVGPAWPDPETPAPPGPPPADARPPPGPGGGTLLTWEVLR